MAPFPEAEDMTIKRLYVAINRDDMQLLQMGAHKLHEKYHTGHKFELLDDLRKILAYVERQTTIPNDVKDLLTKTIADILDGNTPYQEQVNDFTPFEQENPVQSYNSEFMAQEHASTVQEEEQKEPEQLSLTQGFNQDAYNTEIKDEGPVLFTPEKEEASPIDVIYPSTPSSSVFENIQSSKTEQQTPYHEEKVEPEIKNEQFEEFNQTQEDFNLTSLDTIQEVKIPEVIESINSSEEVQTENYAVNQNEEHQTAQIKNEEAPLEIGNKEETQIQEEIKEEQIESSPETLPQEEQASYIEDAKNNEIILEEKESTLENVAVFYDDKATVIDYLQNKLYRTEIDALTLDREAHPLASAEVNKSIVDIPTDEINEIIKMLNTIKGDFYFITTSKSENIIKTFIENYINFEIPLVNEGTMDNNPAKLIPLFGLSNLFTCPKCGYKEYFGGVHNKVLSLQCKKCSSVMYPEISEAENYETTANPYYWIRGMKAMASADTWILINPPLENNRALTAEFIKASFQASKPKKVYILSKETTKKEYYKQLFKEIHPECEVKSEFITQDELCENFINSEMSTLKVTI